MPAFINKETQAIIREALTITITLTNESDDRAVKRVQNILFKSAIKRANFQMLGMDRALYDVRASQPLPGGNWNLRVIPGFVASFSNYQANSMLRIEMKHKLISSKSVYDVLNDLIKEHKSREFVSAELMNKPIISK